MLGSLEVLSVLNRCQYVKSGVEQVKLCSEAITLLKRLEAMPVQQNKGVR